tara:strand:+ start:2130 stop:2576 length:447 start_codon:yes stop_codon:yes gene_type:complete
MAVYTYTTSNVNFGSFDVWSNAGFTDNTDITLSTVLSDAYPAASNPSSVSEIYNRSWFYGNVVAGTNGTVQITYPYTSATSTGTLQIKNVDYGTYSYVRLTAAGTYPYNFSEWRTASGGGGSQISTSADLDLTVSDYTSQQNFYAYFT